MLRSFVRALINEGHLQDVRLGQQVWRSLLRLLRNRDAVAYAIENSPYKRAMRFQGEDIHPSLTGYVVQLSVFPYVQESDRFLHMGEEGDYPERLLDLIIGDVDLEEYGNEFIQDAWFAAASTEERAQLINDYMLDDVDAENGTKRSFMHEFMHKVHADVMGDEALRRAYVGRTGTSERRRGARHKKGWLGAQDAEAYAGSSDKFLRAQEALDEHPEMSLDELIGYILPGRRGGHTPQDRRLVHALSRMWRDRRAELDRDREEWKQLVGRPIGRP